MLYYRSPTATEQSSKSDWKYCENRTSNWPKQARDERTKVWKYIPPEKPRAEALVVRIADFRCRPAYFRRLACSHNLALFDCKSSHCTILELWPGRSSEGVVDMCIAQGKTGFRSRRFSMNLVRRVVGPLAGGSQDLKGSDRWRSTEDFWSLLSFP